MLTFLLLYACTSATEPGLAPAPTEPPPADGPGDFTPGTATTTATSRFGPSLAVQVWFPSSDDPGATAVYGGLWPGEASVNVTPDCSEPRPVVLFSHGYGGMAWQSPWILERLATHGYVVIAPDHTGNTFLDPYGTPFEDLVLRRPFDVRDAYAEVMADPAYADCIDPSMGYAMMGHSFGGYTTLVQSGATLMDLEAACLAGTPEACTIADLWDTTYGRGGSIDLYDPNVWAAVALAPWDAGVLTDGTSEVVVPTLILSGDLDTTTPWDMVSRLHDHLDVEEQPFGKLVNGGHNSFAPISCTLWTGDGCGEGFLDIEEAKEIVNQTAVPFLEEVRGRSTGFPAELPNLEWQ